MQLKTKGDAWQIRFPEGTFSKLNLDDMRKALARKQFLSIDDDPGSVLSRGFVPFDDSDGDMENADLEYNGVWLFNIRTDQRHADKKVANVMVARMEKKRGSPFGKKERKEMLDNAMEKLFREALPIPSHTPVIVIPDSDVAYFQGSFKKIEENVQLLLDALERDTSNVEFFPLGEESEMKDILTTLWHESSLGHGDFEFEPRMVGSDSGKTSSDDETDLAFGFVNGKKCMAGNVILGNGVSFTVKSKDASGIKYDLKLDKPAKEQLEDEGDGAVALMIHENYEKLRELIDSRRNGSVDDRTVRGDFGKKARFTIDNAC